MRPAAIRTRRISDESVCNASASGKPTALHAQTPMTSMAITEAAVRDALRQVIDPELGINIIDLGLVYRVDIDKARVCIVMTMTSPACPLGEYVKNLVDSMIKWHVREVQDVAVRLVWDPPWQPEMMSAEAQQQLDGGSRD